MKVVLYMSITPNGVIARENDETDFVSETEWNHFYKIIKSIGNIVLGRRTYQIMEDNGDLDDLEGINIVTLTHRKDFRTKRQNTKIANSCQSALDILIKQGFKKALIAGGSKLNASFLKEGLIDEIYLDVEPKLLDKGIKLFADADFEADLELIDTKKLSKNEIQLHYKVKKK